MAVERDAKKLLRGLSGLDARTRATEQRILDTATARDDAVRAEMDRLRPAALTDSQASLGYQRAALERRRLAIVIANARRHLR